MWLFQRLEFAHSWNYLSDENSWQTWKRRICMTTLLPDCCILIWTLTDCQSCPGFWIFETINPLLKTTKSLTQIWDQTHCFNISFHFFKCTREFAFDDKSWCIATSWLNFQKSSLCQKFYCIVESYSWFRWCYNLLLSCLQLFLTIFYIFSFNDSLFGFLFKKSMHFSDFFRC